VKVMPPMSSSLGLVAAARRELKSAGEELPYWITRWVYLCVARAVRKDGEKAAVTRASKEAVAPVVMKHILCIVVRAEECMCLDRVSDVYEHTWTWLIYYMLTCLLSCVPVYAHSSSYQASRLNLGTGATKKHKGHFGNCVAPNLPEPSPVSQPSPLPIFEISNSNDGFCDINHNTSNVSSPPEVNTAIQLLIM
jgi:hypothetical protein